MESWALAIAILSAIFSGLAWWSTRRQAVASLEMVEIERARHAAESIETSAAQIVPELAAGGAASRFIRIIDLRNAGRATAVSLEATIDPTDTSPLEVIDHGNFPCDVPPGASVSLVLHRQSVDGPQRVAICLTWIDGTGPRTERTTVSLV